MVQYIEHEPPVFAAARLVVETTLHKKMNSGFRKGVPESCENCVLNKKSEGSLNLRDHLHHPMEASYCPFF